MAKLAARQYGIVTRPQLADLGYTDRTIDHVVRLGRLQAWHQDVFALGHGGLSRHGLCMAAVLFRGEGALISHQSAVCLWGIEPRLEIPVNVSLRHRVRAGIGIGLHHCPALRDEDLARTERLPVTAVPRTLLDFAAVAERYRLDAAIDRAERLEILDLAAVDRIVDEVRGHQGRRRLETAVRTYREVGLTRPDGEERLLAALADAGIAPPAVSDFVDGQELDFFWERERFAVELDGRGRQRDAERSEEPAPAGVETIRITRTRLKHEPDEVAARIGEHLDRRRAKAT